MLLKSKVCKKCRKTFPLFTIVDGKRRNLGSRRYCLECKAFGVNDRRNLVKKITHCVLCEKITERGRRLCGSCQTKVRRRRAKLAAIKMLGGKCNRCGYKRHWAALEFHHKDPKKKDFSIGRFIGKSWKRVKEEIKKCELLCSNCHRIEHSDGDNKKFLAEVERYKGTELVW